MGWHPGICFKKLFLRSAHYMPPRGNYKLQLYVKKKRIYVTVEQINEKVKSEVKVQIIEPIVFMNSGSQNRLYFVYDTS